MPNNRQFFLSPALCGFLLLLVLVFTASYAVGRSSGPVAPGMHAPGITPDRQGGPETQDSEDMDDMHGSGS
jgi:hypothetical protein